MTKQKMLKADIRVPNMGLNNQPCLKPKYWCRLYEIWLSEDDVKKKSCLNKLTADMREYRRCGCLEEKDYELFLSRLSARPKRGEDTNEMNCRKTTDGSK